MGAIAIARIYGLKNELRKLPTETSYSRWTYMLSGSSWLRRAERLLITKEEDLTRPPRIFAKVRRLSRTMEIAPPHPSFSGLTVGRTSGSFISLVNLKKVSNGPLGMQRITAPHGMDTKPKANDMPHSRPPIRTTWNAAPPTNTIKTWTIISLITDVSTNTGKPLQRHTKQCDPDKVRIVANTLKNIELVVETPTIDRIEDLCKHKGIKD